MTQKYLFLFFTLSAVLLEVGGDIFFRRWALEHRSLLLTIGFALYLTGTCFWVFSIRYEYLSKAISVFTILNLIAGVLAGVLLFHEELLWQHKVGILLGIVSIVLLEL